MSEFPTARRKRGRPRREDSNSISNFDEVLIDEFRKRPALYDPNHNDFRNREYCQELWEEIAGSLNNSVSFVKDRATQLRSRYSVEKRRIGNDGGSPWTLYPKLEFLSDFIRTRRAATLNSTAVRAEMEDTSLSDRIDDDENDSNVRHDRLRRAQHSDGENNFGSIQTIKVATMMSPKCELLSQANSNTNINNANTNNNNNNNNQCVNSTIRSQIAQPTQKLILPQTDARIPLQLLQQHQNQHQQTDSFNNFQAMQSAAKFSHFGQFVASSLSEMNETDAILLVNKYTSEVCGLLLAEQRNRSN